ncbi:Hypothetical protein SMB2099_3060 [Serratia marcescens SMB2099]|nr:Hypothetical protein SMB2099_3060 [Serratia marcescens SMB2099]
MCDGEPRAVSQQRQQQQETHATALQQRAEVQAVRGVVQLAGVIEKVKLLVKAVAEERRLFYQRQAVAPDADANKALLIQLAKARQQHFADRTVNDGENHSQRAGQQKPQPPSRPVSIRHRHHHRERQRDQRAAALRQHHECQQRRDKAQRRFLPGIAENHQAQQNGDGGVTGQIDHVARPRIAGGGFPQMINRRGVDQRQIQAQRRHAGQHRPLQLMTPLTVEQRHQPGEIEQDISAVGQGRRHVARRLAPQRAEGIIKQKYQRQPAAPARLTIVPQLPPQRRPGEHGGQPQQRRQMKQVIDAGLPAKDRAEKREG